MKDERIVIVGGGLAAARVVKGYREAGGEGSLTMFSADTALPYNRPPLSKGYLRGEVEADSVLVEPEAFYAEAGVEVRLATRVTGVDTSARTVAVDGERIGYDRLVLASGWSRAGWALPARSSTAFTHIGRSQMRPRSARRRHPLAAPLSSAPASSAWRRPPR